MDALKVINGYLTQLIEKSDTCKKCVFHYNCFFASKCFPNYTYYKKEEDSKVKLFRPPFNC